MSRRSHTALLILSILWLSPQTPGQDQATLAFPLAVGELDLRQGVRLVSPRREDLAALRAYDRVLLADVLLPDGSTAALRLERLHVEQLGIGLFLDGRRASAAQFDDDLSLWSGVVAGVEDSDVYLGFSSQGCRGWVRRGTELVHLVTAPDEGGDWSRGSSWWLDERLLDARDERLGSFCGTSRLGPSLPRMRASGQNNAKSTDQPIILECKIAMEGDYQLFTHFGNVGAELSYVTMLLGAISDRYAQQLDVVLTFPYLNLWTIPGDPWITPDIGGDSLQYLEEFRSAWAGNIPGGAHLAHLLSGAPVGGGVAYLDVLCNPFFGFGLSGDLDAQMGFPPAPGPLTWDFVVIAHEIGHNFDAIHTHDYCPPIDECAPPAYHGPCQGQTVCTSQGTVMGYCHLCGGGMSNVTLFFHPQSVADMRSAAESSCFPAISMSVSPANPVVHEGCLGGPFSNPAVTYTLGNPSASPISYQVTLANPAGILIGGGTTPVTGVLAPGGSAQVTATLDPAVSTFVSGQYVDQILFEDLTNGSTTSVEHVIEIGRALAYSFPLDSDPGWTKQGQWAFGVPSGGGGQSGWPDPTSGFTGSNVLGYNLNGDYPNNLPERHLTSTAIDCTGLSAVRVGFERWLNVEEALYDHAYFRVSNDGVNFVTIWQNGAEIADSGWRHQELDISAVADGRATVYLRWTMGSTDSSVIYSGWNLDDIWISAIRPGLGSTPTTAFCTAKAGLVCGPPTLAAFGMSSAAATNGFVIAAGPARGGRLGVLMYNTTRGLPMPFQGGTLCITPQGLRRGGPTHSLGTPNLCDGAFAIDMNAFAQGLWIVPPSGTVAANIPAGYLGVAGTNVYVQYWGRDSVATGSFVSAGLLYTVCP